MEIIFAAATMILVYFIVFQTLFAQQSLTMAGVGPGSRPPFDMRTNLALSRAESKFSYDECYDIDQKSSPEEKFESGIKSPEGDKVRYDGSDLRSSPGMIRNSDRGNPLENLMTSQERLPNPKEGATLSIYALFITLSAGLHTTIPPPLGRLTQATRTKPRSCRIGRQSESQGKVSMQTTGTWSLSEVKTSTW